MGDTLATTDVVGERVSSAPKREEWAAEIASTREGLSAARTLSLMDDQMPWPEHEPAVSTLLSDNTGRLWVRGPHVAPDSARWTVYGPQGARLGWTVLPDHVNLEAASGETVWGWAPGEYDVPLPAEVQHHRLRFLSNKPLKQSDTVLRSANACGACT